MVEIIPQPQSTLQRFRFDLPPSKSVANRFLMLQFLHKETIELSGNNFPADIHRMISCLNELKSGRKLINVDEAGTVARFTVALSAQHTQNTIRIDGTARMRMRPIGGLVEALQRWGAQIKYLDKPGYLPLEIAPSKFTYCDLEFSEQASSQFISALLMMASKSETPIAMRISRRQGSLPYIKMTTDLINALGGSTSWSERPDCWEIKIQPSMLTFPDWFQIESDWSAAHYWIAASAIVPAKWELIGLPSQSFQGDSEVVLKGLHPNFDQGNVATIDSNNHLQLDWPTSLDFTNQPDLAPTYVVLAAIQHVSDIKFKGLKSLSVKESNRMEVLREHLSQFQVEVRRVSDDIWELNASDFRLPDTFIVDPHDDHRMAMSLALLALLVRTKMKDHRCVAKSYPAFWNHFSQLPVKLVTYE
jgi:3-phosphoshikimate 1-carboxyvinyltransferase